MKEPDLKCARESALRCIKRFGISEPKEIDLESIAWAMGIEVRESTLRSAEAQLLRMGKHGIIRLRSGMSDQPRGRFSIGHELGHWSLHGMASQYWICSPENIHQYAGGRLEVEANAFASELLMPTPLFRPICRGRSTDFSLADELASKFRTSLQATVLRMIDESDEAAVAVLTDGKRVCWAKRNTRRLPEFEFHIKRDAMLQANTLAWNAILDGDATDYVDPTAWFPSLSDSERYSVQEDVRFIEDYDLTLSILVVQEN